MTMPHLMNCSHADDGWCLDCVKDLWDTKERATIRADRLFEDSMIAHRWFETHFGEDFNGRDFAVKCPMADDVLAQDQPKLTAQQYLLICLMEECGELTQRASKALRFGVGEIQPGQEKTNWDRLTDEYSDVKRIADLLKIIPYETIPEKRHRWREAIILSLINNKVLSVEDSKILLNADE